MRRNIIGIPLHDGKTGCAVHRGGWQPALFLYVPCYCGSVRTDALPKLAERFFTAEGFTYLGVNLYDSWEKSARNLSDPITLEDHVEDIWSFTRFARSRGVLDVYVVGHSLSAYPVLMSAKAPDEDAAPTGVILWDGSVSVPTLNPKDDGGRYDAEHDYYVRAGGSGAVVSRRYYDSVQGFRIGDLAKDWSTPVLAIEAGEGILRGEGGRYRDHLGESWVTVSVIPGADHHFLDDDKANQQLFYRTLDWMKSH